jgi:hypothetical protein
MKHPLLPVLTACALALAALGAAGKLPPPPEEAKAKAAETAAKNAWNDKVAAFKLCQSQDRVVAAYREGARKAGKTADPPVATPPCADPGPFEYQPADKPPIEQSGAHSPPATAVNPPSTTTPAAATSATR